MATDRNITVYMHADTSAYADGMADALAETLEAETGIPAATWREAIDLDGDRVLFGQALDIWRYNFATTTVDPRTVVADLKSAKDA